jgi:amylosucrase
VWSGDELGMPNDPGWAREPGHEDDNRWAHRERLDWTVAARRDDLDTVSGKVFQGLHHLAGVRAGLPQLHASAQTRVLLETDDGVLAVIRTHPSGSMVCVYNVTASWQTVDVRHFADVGIAHPFDALGGYPVFGGADGLAALSPYAAWWVVEAPVEVLHA